MNAKGLKMPSRSSREERTGYHSTFDSFSRYGVASNGRDTVDNAVIEMILLMALAEIRDGIVVCDAQGLIVLANAGAKQLSVQDPEGKALDLASDIWGELFDSHGSHIAVEDWPLYKALRGEDTSYKQCRFVRPDGTASDVLFSAAPLVDLAHRNIGAVATLTDISQQKRDEAALREQALERERSRMATHIHDTVSQTLTGLMLQLQAAESDLHKAPETAGIYLQHALAAARDGLAELRRCIWTLSHESLEGDDLAEALTFLTERFFAATPIDLELSLQPEAEVLPREVRHEILWISKEAMANVLKHSHATRVRVELHCGTKDVQLRVKDNGVGFGQVHLRSANGSFGLISMRKRAERLGGTVAIDSEPGKGTSVSARVPCTQCLAA
jgi:signal transduction histidine kinase